MIVLIAHIFGCIIYYQKTLASPFIIMNTPIPTIVTIKIQSSTNIGFE